MAATMVGDHLENEKPFIKCKDDLLFTGCNILNGPFSGNFTEDSMDKGCVNLTMSNGFGNIYLF